jgi:hypothetical protein
VHIQVSDEVTAFRWVSEAEIAELSAEAYAIRLLDAMVRAAVGARPGLREIAANRNLADAGRRLIRQRMSS